MSLLDTDQKLVGIIKKLGDRPEPPITKMVSEAITILQQVASPKPRSADILAARARLSDGRTKLIVLKLTIIAEESLIRGVLTDTETYLQAKFLSFLNSVKNQGGRVALISQAVLPIARRLRRLESARERIEEVVKDYDSRAYAIRDTIEALKLGERES